MSDSNSRQGRVRSILKRTRERRDVMATESMDHDFPKMAKSLVRYRNAEPENLDNEMLCGTCRFFEREDSYCHLVEGQINAEDVCDFWAPTEARVEQTTQ